MLVRVPVSVGELLDKISILRIKTQRIADAEKVANVQRELDALNEEIAQMEVDQELLNGFLQELEQINGELWVIEDDIRACESHQDFR